MSQNLLLVLYIFSIIFSQNLINAQFAMRIQAHNDEVNDVKIHPKNEQIATVSEDKTLKIWHQKTLSLISTMNANVTRLWAVEFLDDGDLIAAAGCETTIQIWNFFNRSLNKTIDTAGFHCIWNLLKIPNTDFLIASSQGENIKMFNYLTGELLRTFNEKEENSPTGFGLLAFIPGTELFAAGSFDGNVYVFNQISGKTIKIFRGGSNSSTDSFAITQIKNTAYIASSSQPENDIQIWNQSSGENQATLMSHDQGVSSMNALSPANDQIICGYWDGLIKIQDQKKGNLIETLDFHHKKTVWAIAAFNNSLNFVSASGDSTVAIWQEFCPSSFQTDLAKKECVESRIIVSIISVIGILWIFGIFLISAHFFKKRRWFSPQCLIVWSKIQIAIFSLMNLSFNLLQVIMASFYQIVLFYLCLAFLILPGIVIFILHLAKNWEWNRQANQLLQNILFGPISLLNKWRGQKTIKFPCNNCQNIFRIIAVYFIQILGAFAIFPILQFIMIFIAAILMIFAGCVEGYLKYSVLWNIETRFRNSGLSEEDKCHQMINVLMVISCFWNQLPTIVIVIINSIQTLGIIDFYGWLLLFSSLFLFFQDLFPIANNLYKTRSIKRTIEATNTNYLLHLKDYLEQVQRSSQGDPSARHEEIIEFPQA